MLPFPSPPSAIPIPPIPGVRPPRAERANATLLRVSLEPAFAKNSRGGPAPRRVFTSVRGICPSGGARARFAAILSSSSFGGRAGPEDARDSTGEPEPTSEGVARQIQCGPHRRRGPGPRRNSLSMPYLGCAWVFSSTAGEAARDQPPGGNSHPASATCRRVRSFP